MMPSCDHTGVPIHFHSSTTPGSASLMSVRILPRVLPRQSPSSAILFEMSSDADRPWLAPDFFMFSLQSSTLAAGSIGSSYRGTSAHPVVKTQKSQAPDPELMVGAQYALGIDVDPNCLLQCADVTRPPVARLGFDKEVEPRIPESRTRRPHRETAAGIRFGPHDDH